MRKVGYGIVAVGALFWITIGAVAFSTKLNESGSHERTAASAAFAYYDPSGPYEMEYGRAAEPYMYDSGLYYGTSYLIYQPLEPIVFYDTIEVIYDEPWYDWALPGYYGSVARSIIPGLTQTAAAPISVTAPYVPPPPARPTCSITVNPTRVPYGSRAVVSWVSNNADSAILQGVGAVSVHGSYAANSLTSTRTFYLSVVGRGGTNSCVAQVDVEPLVSEGPTCILSAHPSVVSRGETVNIAWGSENGASATLSGFGQVPLRGGVTATPVNSTSYTLSVRSYGGQVTNCGTMVTVR